MRAVKEAKRIRGIKIVNFDWLEDSLMSRGNGLKSVNQYLWKSVFQEHRKKELEKKANKTETVSEAGASFFRFYKSFDAYS